MSSPLLAQTWASFVADVVAVALTAGLLAAVLVGSWVLAFVAGVAWVRRRHARALVLAAVEDEVAVTVPLPAQRSGEQ